VITLVFASVLASAQFDPAVAARTPKIVSSFSSPDCPGSAHWHMAMLEYFVDTNGTTLPRDASVTRVGTMSVQPFLNAIAKASECGVTADVDIWDMGDNIFPVMSAGLDVIQADFLVKGYDAVMFRYPDHGERAYFAGAAGSRRVVFPILPQDLIDPDVGAPYVGLLWHEWLHLAISNVEGRVLDKGLPPDDLHYNYAQDPEYLAQTNDPAHPFKYFEDFMSGRVLRDGKAYGFTKKDWIRIGTPTHTKTRIGAITIDNGSWDAGTGVFSATVSNPQFSITLTIGGTSPRTITPSHVYDAASRSIKFSLPLAAEWNVCITTKKSSDGYWAGAKECKYLLFKDVTPMRITISLPIYHPASVDSPTVSREYLTISQDHLTGYNQALFKLWIDVDKDGCDTRAEVLIEEAVIKPKIGKNCTLTGGKWLSPYDAKKTSKAFDLRIDHVVPLAEAWRSGAWAWTPAQRQAFANDLEEPQALVAVSLGQTRSKGDKDVASWLPQKDVCTYMTNWLAIKYRYSLTVDIAEARVINSYLASCIIKNIAVTVLPEYLGYLGDRTPQFTHKPAPQPSDTPTQPALINMPSLPTPALRELDATSFEISVPEISGWDFSAMKLALKFVGTGPGDCAKVTAISSLPFTLKCSGILTKQLWIVYLTGNGTYGKVEPDILFSESLTFDSRPKSATSQRP